jgi:hypothetical protein
MIAEEGGEEVLRWRRVTRRHKATQAMHLEARESLARDIA